MHSREHKKNSYTCVSCNHHERIGSAEYFEIFFDNNEFTEFDANLSSGDPLVFKDTKAYPDRIVASQKKTGLKDAVRNAYGKGDGAD